MRDTLRTTLIKSAEDVETFDRLFDLFFGLRARARPPAAPCTPHVHESGRRSPPSCASARTSRASRHEQDRSHADADPSPSTCVASSSEEQLRPSHDIHGETERLRLSVFGQKLVLQRNPDALQRRARARDPPAARQRARSFNPGAHRVRDRRGGAADRPARRRRSPSSWTTCASSESTRSLVQAVTAQADDILRALPELLEALLERQRRLAPDRRSAADAASRRSLRTLLDLPAAEQRELEAAIRRLGRPDPRRPRAAAAARPHRPDQPAAHAAAQPRLRGRAVRAGAAPAARVAARAWSCCAT